MEISPVQNVCQKLINYAIQRCRISESLCRLSIILKYSPDSDPPAICIAISDTGAGSSLAEFQDLNRHFCRYRGRIRGVSPEKWDGVLSITTTSVHDKEISHYHLILGETVLAMRLRQLASTAKNGGNFSGTEVSLSTQERIDICLAWMTCFCRKILILKIPKMAIELLVQHLNITNSRCEVLLQTNEGILLPYSMSNIERLTSGLEDYALEHGNALDKESERCFSNREHLKVGTGLAREIETLKQIGLIVEAVIILMEVSESSNTPSLRAYGTTTEVLYFQDFCPSSIPRVSLNALTSIDWQSYGLSLKSNLVDFNGNAVLEWENLPPTTHINIVLHSYHNEVMIQETRQNTSVDKNLVKKAVKLALDDLKAKYAGLLLSKRALKIKEHAPDLSRAIAGLILSSNDLEFQGECASLLGLLPLNLIEEGRLDTCIREKIVGIIEKNDRNPKRGKEDAQYLFEERKLREDDEDDEDEDGHEDIGIGVWDL